MKPNHKLAAMLIALFCLPLTATAEEGEVIDDITVVGKKSASELRRDVFEAEEDFYTLYNELNDEDDFHVSCFYETPTGTRIKNHVCRANYIAASYAKQANRRGMDRTRIASQDSDPAMAEKTARFQTNLETLLAGSPELQNALARYNTARANFAAVHQN